MNIATMPHGSFDTFGDNETRLSTTKDDAVKHRLSKPGQGRGIGCISANQIRDGGGGEDEVALFQMKRRNDDPSNLEGEYWIGVNDGSGAGDAAMVPALILHKDRIWMPVAVLQSLLEQLHALGGTLPTLPPSAPARLISPDGNTQLELQNDGGFVRYQRQPDDSFKATWSADIGKL